MRFGGVIDYSSFVQTNRFQNDNQQRAKRAEKNEANHHPKPLLPLLWANPALMSDKVNQPTA